MKNKKGFTLVELLAVIVILAIILIIAIPKIGNVIDTSKRNAFKTTNAMIESSAKRKASIDSLETSTITPITYTFTNGVISPALELTGELPLTGTVEVNSEGKVQILTKNDKYCALKRFNEGEIEIFDRDDRLCNIVVEVTLTVDPAGGTYNGTSEITEYQVEPDHTQDVGDPERADYRFDGWTFEAETGTFVDGTFTASISDATLTATWTEFVNLTVEMDGGSGQTFESRYAPGEPIVLEEPTKNGYELDEWIVTGEGASITGSVIKTLTIGTTDTTLTATWKNATYSINYTLNDGTVSGNPETYDIDSESITLINPTREGYIFTGWTGSNGTTPQTSVTIPTGSYGNKSYTANWLSYTNMFTYTLTNGNAGVAGTDYEVITDTTRCTTCWKIRLLTSGTFRALLQMDVDIFLVGGGGGGAGGSASTASSMSAVSGSGGGGGYTKTVLGETLLTTKSYQTVIGSGGTHGASGNNPGGAGGSSSFDTYTIGGGAGGTWGKGGNGGSGGGGGSNRMYTYDPGGKGGSNGTSGAQGNNASGGIGQAASDASKNTYEFGETSSGILYAGGGSGGSHHGGYTVGTNGGGGNGAGNRMPAGAGAANTGGGGGAGRQLGSGDPTAYCSGATGGTGIVIIRNHQ